MWAVTIGIQNFPTDAVAMNEGCLDGAYDSIGFALVIGLHNGASA